MSPAEMIYRRKSVRSYENRPVEEEQIRRMQEFFASIRPLYPEIRVAMEIVKRDEVRCILPWTTRQLIAMYTEDRPGALENLGFMFQQLDLYLQSIGIGTCWLGMGRMDRKSAAVREDGLSCRMLMTFGYPKGPALRESKSEFKRKKPEEIADTADERLEPARFAPSSINSQPWYFLHDGDGFHLYCGGQGMMKMRMISDMNRIDVGIALAHLYVSNPETFRFTQADRSEPAGGRIYIGSFAL